MCIRDRTAAIGPHRRDGPRLNELMSIEENTRSKIEAIDDIPGKVAVEREKDNGQRRCILHRRTWRESLKKGWTFFTSCLSHIKRHGAGIHHAPFALASSKEGHYICIQRQERR